MLPQSTPRLADLRASCLQTSPVEVQVIPDISLSPGMASISLELAFKRLSLRSSTLCRQCRRLYTSTTARRETQSATRAFSGMPLPSISYEHPINPPQTMSNLLEPSPCQPRSQIDLQTHRHRPPSHQPPSPPSPHPTHRDNAHPTTLPAT